MEKVNNQNMEKIIGGTTTINGPIINAVVNVINVLKEAGYSIGSGIRRMVENEMCPLK